MARHRYIIWLALIPLFQAAMMSALLYSDSSPHRWIPGTFALAALLVPFVAYIAAGYDVPIFHKWSRVVKAGVLTLASIFLTLGGYIILFMGGLWITGEPLGPRLPESDTCLCGLTHWSKFSTDSGGFSVLMPCPPKASTTTNETPAGPLVIYAFTAEPSRVQAFSVLHNRFQKRKSASRERVFQAGLKSALGEDGKLVSESRIKLQGFDGHEWKFERFKGQVMFVMRIFVVKDELYEAVCYMPKSRFCPRHSRKFLDSFELIGRSGE